MYPRGQVTPCTHIVTFLSDIAIQLQEFELVFGHTELEMDGQTDVKVEIVMLRKHNLEKTI